MRLKIKLKPENGLVSLPYHYNEFVQSFIYHHLDDWLATKLHDEGFKDIESNRSLKFFTFSRLIPETKPQVKDKKILFRGPINLIVSSPIPEFIQSFASNLLRTERIFLAHHNFELLSVEVMAVPSYRERVIVKVLSPITVYSTFKALDGKKKTYYYNPFEKEFEDLILRNLQRKVRALSKDNNNLPESELKGCSIKSYRVNKTNERIVIYKSTVIKGWDGLYELKLSPELFKMAFTAGLGAKNSQGFGCVEVWKPSHIKRNEKKNLKSF